jgi:integrase
MALTQKGMRGLIARGEVGRHFDKEGLSLIVASKTSAHWERRYQLNGKARTIGLGSVKAFDLHEARERNRKITQALADGNDPLDIKRAEQEQRRAAAAAAVKAVTFREMAERFIADNQAGWRSAVHGQQWVRSLQTYVYPIIGARAVKDIDMPDILAVLEQPVGAGNRHPAGKFWETRNPSAARLRSRLELILNYSMARGARPHGFNPAALNIVTHALPKPAKLATVTSFAAMSYDQIPRLMATLTQREGVAAMALRFLVLTAARTGEVVGATWDEIDFNNKVWTLPPARMKSGREHKVPLSDAAIDLLRGALREANNSYVFIGQNKPMLSPNAMMAVLRRLGHNDVTGHGFRATFRTWCAEKTDYPSELPELALAHAVDKGTVARYKRTTLFDKRRELMQRWATFCCSPPHAGGDVVPMKRSGARP